MTEGFVCKFTPQQYVQIVNFKPILRNSRKT